MATQKHARTRVPCCGIPSRRPGSTLVALGLGLWLVGNAWAGDGAPTPTICGAKALPDDILERLNAARARGAACREAAARSAAAPLAWNPRLAEVAALQSREMAALDRLGHVDAHHHGLGERLRSGGYAYSFAAENVAVGYASLDAVIQAWMDSETHCGNIMNPAAQELGVACVDGEKSGDPVQDRYWTMVIGRPKSGQSMAGR